MRREEEAIEIIANHIESVGDAELSDALRVLNQWVSRVRGAELEMTSALGPLDEIAGKMDIKLTDEVIRNRPYGSKLPFSRKYNLSDARKAAKIASDRLRRAWQFLDPIDS